MNQNEINEAYDSAAQAYVDRCFNELDYKPLDRLLLDRFVALTQKKGVLCDIGCGPGEIAHYLHTKGCDVVGIDISEKMIEQAKKLDPNVTYKVGDMFGLDEPEAAFSGVCAFYAIVNFRYDKIRKILKEYHRVLENNGVLLLAFHVDEKEIHVDDFFGGGKPLDFYYHDESVVISMLRETGFRIIEALVRFPYEQEFPSKRAYITCRK